MFEAMTAFIYFPIASSNPSYIMRGASYVVLVFSLNFPYGPLTCTGKPLLFRRCFTLYKYWNPLHWKDLKGLVS